MVLLAVREVIHANFADAKLNYYFVIRKGGSTVGQEWITQGTCAAPNKDLRCELR
jgi:hypothetical protein